MTNPDSRSETRKAFTLIELLAYKTLLHMQQSFVRLGSRPLAQISPAPAGLGRRIPFGWAQLNSKRATSPSVQRIGNPRYSPAGAGEIRATVQRLTRSLVLLLTLALTPALAEPITSDRISALPPADQVAWKSYLERSQTSALADQTAVQAEVSANKMTNALRAPNGGDFKLPAKMDNVWNAWNEAKQLADAVLSYQTPSGGWSKHTGYSKGPRQPGMQWTSQNETVRKPHYVGTFDNRATTEEMNFLAAVWHATKREDCKAGFIKGLNFIFAAQYPNGGWPQGYPLEGDYHDNITFNDDAMTHILELLSAITRRERYYAFLDKSQRSPSALATATTRSTARWHCSTARAGASASSNAVRER